ncbi:MBL fold metallo-hydrolase [Hazenella coriacea]|uniref:Glyoxylase-like metal-dependent hydrolase (Beta-lactamase superfamily II) n=1 Tax=Hazenella coriacea TaxID=1179467 RepID=A0A4R3LBH6_9BACL|nr:MBL fold metallo-hydrolase [Hazenella coriacea]TCS96570.1 glyoxylase-like metal-dependent hydrolase (beta-lactamase superfamily II) [Hazenella coriacea]
MAVTAIKAKELHEKMNSGQSVLILDVRNREDFDDWKIEHKHIESINIPYFDFLDEDEATFNQIPKEADIVVICAKGGSAQMVTEMLDERGYQVSYLEGGMKEWSQFYHPITVVKEGNFELIQVNRLAKGCLSYMMISEGQALVVDPGRHMNEYVTLAKEKNATIQHIVDTHLHADHISGAIDLAKETGAKYYISSSEMQGSPLPYEPLEQNKHLKIGQADVKIIAVPTPGHTPGSVSILVNDQYLLSGDTIFVGGLGRPDLGGKVREWAQSLYETVFNTVSTLSDDVIVLPSHYADIKEITEAGYVGALLGEIRKANEIMRTEDREQFTEMVASNVGATPPNFEEIVQINRGSMTVPPEKATELEIGPNRCAIHHS